MLDRADIVGSTISRSGVDSVHQLKPDQPQRGKAAVMELFLKLRSEQW